MVGVVVVVDGVVVGLVCCLLSVVYRVVVWCVVCVVCCVLLIVCGCLLFVVCALGFVMHVLLMVGCLLSLVGCCVCHMLFDVGWSVVCSLSVYSCLFFVGVCCVLFSVGR